MNVEQYRWQMAFILPISNSLTQAPTKHAVISGLKGHTVFKPLATSRLTSYPVSVPSTSFARPTTTQSSTSTISAFPLPTFPLAVGSTPNCLEYARGVPRDEPIKGQLNTYSFMANAYKVSADSLLKWNPSLSRASYIFSSEVRYHVSKDKKTGIFSHKAFSVAQTNVLRIPYLDPILCLLLGLQATRHYGWN